MRGDGSGGRERPISGERPKRGHGEGAVYREPSGRYRAQVMVAGERRSRTFNTRADALDWVADLRSRQRKGQLAPRAAERETLATCLRRWLEGRRAEGLGEKSWRNHERNVALHIVPCLGSVRLPELTVAHLRGLLAALQPPVGTLGPRSVRHVHTTLRQALDQAVDDGLVPRNVARSPQLKAPKLPRRGALKTLRQDELRAFLRAADGDRLATLWRFAVRTGCREGELRALQWEDLDRRAGAVTIRRNLPAGITELEEAKAPKSHAGGRTFRLSRALLADLEAHRKRQAEERLRVGAAYRDQDLVFCTKWGTALGSGNILRRFRQLLTRAGVQAHYVVHDLRHTAASVLIMRGTPLTEVAQILGHAGPHVTAAVYAHLVPRAGRTALEEAEDFYGGLERPPADPATLPGRASAPEAPEPGTVSGSA